MLKKLSRNGSSALTYNVGNKCFTLLPHQPRSQGLSSYHPLRQDEMRDPGNEFATARALYKTTLPSRNMRQLMVIDASSRLIAYEPTLFSIVSFISHGT